MIINSKRFGDLSQTTVVFDLDDTLYPEADYLGSGLIYVCSQIKKVYGRDVYPPLSAALSEDAKMDWIALAARLAGIPDSAKDSLLWMYRLHEPDISLSEECKSALDKIESRASAVAILTDGRSVSQRLKLKSLGLAHLPAYISEEYGATKPAPDGYLKIENDFKANRYIYVADNPKKDFRGCNPLGWIGIGMRGNQRNIHVQSSMAQCADDVPKYWVGSWEELTALLFGS